MPETVKVITTQKDRNACIQLCKTCFSSDMTWQDVMFPLPGTGSYALGHFSDARIRQAAGSIRMDMHYFGTVFPVTGISAVASDPAYRGQGGVQALLSNLLKREYRSGRALAFLYPLNHSFYNKTGFGSLVDCDGYEFAPENIAAPDPEGQWEPLGWTAKTHREMTELVNWWGEQYHGTVLWPFRTHAHENRLAAHYGTQYYQYRRAGTASAWIGFSRAKEAGQEVLTLYKSTWTDPESFQAIFSFLSRFRSQVSRIRIRLPGTIPVRFLMKDAHISRTGSALWMGRPLDFARVLQTKLDYQGAGPSFAFSIEDPVLEENTGTYRVTEGRVHKESGLTAQILPFHLASSLMLGGTSLRSLVDAGILADTGFSPEMYESFYRDEDIFVSEMF